MGLLDKIFKQKNTVSVRFVDHSNDEIIGITEMPADQLPETFSTATTMRLQDKEWSVVEAMPEHSSDFIKSGQLVLKLSRIEYVDPQSILFSLPTISSELPALTGNSLFDAFETELREDDWRQHEFLDTASLALIDVEMAAVKEIWAHHSVETSASFNAFRKCHVRNTIGEPGLQLDFKRLKVLLDIDETGSLKLNGHFVVNGFSFKTANTVFYGTLEGNFVTQLCISDFNDHTIHEIQAVTTTFELVFVNWYHCDIIAEM